jgi:sec-independent protein translocase protein TatA
LLKPYVIQGKKMAIINSTDILDTGSTNVFAGNFGSPMQLLILLAIVLLLFGGKRLRNLGGDIGGALKGFKSAMNTEEPKTQEPIQHQQKPLHLQTNELEKDRGPIGG